MFSLWGRTLNTQQQVLVARLKEGELSLNRFLKVGPDKAAFEFQWEQRLYSPDAFNSYPRWGICGKDFLVLIDTDDPKMYDEIAKVLPETFEVTSPKRGLPHRYYVVCGEQVPNKTLHIPGVFDEKGRLKALGEIRADDEYLVAPGTEITWKTKEGEMKTGMYQITKDIPIKRLEREDFMGAIAPYIEQGGNNSQKITPDEMAKGVSAGERHAKGVRYADHLLGRVKLDYSTTFHELKRWNQLNDPPMPEKDLKHIMNCAVNFIASKTKLSPIEVKAHGAIVNRIDNLEFSTKIYPNYYDFCNEEGLDFKPAKVAQWLAHNEHFKTERSTESIFYGDESKGRWAPDGEVKLQELLTVILGDENRISHYNNILHDLKGLTYTDIIFSEKIACENGLLDVETGELNPFNLDEMAFHSIPTIYDEKTTSQKWLDFINQVLSPEDAQTLQEWSGYILLPRYSFHKMMWLHGGGRNGKGVWQRTIEGVIGKDNVSGVGLEEFDGNHRFALRQLYGKLFNPCSEPITSHKKALRTELLKKATGQDSIKAECKGTDKRIEFTNTSKITILANKFPTVKDDTTAFKERRIIVKFPNEFTGNTQIQDLENTWLNDPTQKSAILNWMLEGLHRLLANHGFSESKTQKDIELEFQRASDTVGAFLSELGVFGKNYICTRAEAYEAYQTYCEIYGLQVESDKDFTQTLEQNPKISKGKTKGVRAWKGVTFSTLSEDDGQTELMVKGTDGTHLPPNIPPAISSNCINIDGSKQVSQVSQVSLSEEYLTYKNRLCSVECQNFRSISRKCPARNADYRAENAELPCKCSAYEQKSLEES
jgi:P4 family phage/plasmid primase-like protien